MPILTKEVEIKLWGNNIKHYLDLGYEGKHGDVIIVKVEDLTDGSNVKIKYLCDYCKKEVITIVYADLVRRTKETDKMACRNCFTKKMEETNLLRYGASSYAETNEFKEIMRNMMEEKYGVQHYSKTQEYKEKWNKTCEERFGKNYRQQFINKAFETFYEKTGYNYPSQSPKVREKIMQSYIDHYGVNSPQLSSEVRERTEKTCLERYGCATPFQSAEIKQKIANTSYKNGSVPTSKQQLYLFNLYKSIDGSAKLNYPILHFNADICLPEEKIDIELDCGGHNLSVKTGQLTQEQFTRKELIRDKVIKKEGYKLIRIKSKIDLLPSDQILLQMLFEARNYFFKYPNHSWIEYDIDNSIVRNSECKNGAQYNYGKLRRIKSSDLP
jgi:hypothetical protein